MTTGLNVVFPKKFVGIACKTIDDNIMSWFYTYALGLN